MSHEHDRSNDPELCKLICELSGYNPNPNAHNSNYTIDVYHELVDRLIIDGQPTTEEPLLQVYNCLRQRSYRQRKRDERDQQDMEFGSHHNGEPIWSEDHAGEAIDLAIEFAEFAETLNPERQTIFAMLLANHTTKEIAQTLGVSRRTADRLVHKVRAIVIDRFS